MCFYACIPSEGWMSEGHGGGGGWVQPQSHHTAEEHPLGYQPAPQPRAPPAPSPTGAPVILSMRPDTQ